MEAYFTYLISYFSFFLNTTMEQHMTEFDPTGKWNKKKTNKLVVDR